jgi:hypothetical protein
MSSQFRCFVQDFLSTLTPCVENGAEGIAYRYWIAIDSRLVEHMQQEQAGVPFRG